jgi:lysozyme
MSTHGTNLKSASLVQSGRLAAISSFIYNLGAGAYRGSTLRKRINASDWEGAKEQIIKWNKAGGKVLRGLTKRREAEAALL